MTALDWGLLLIVALSALLGMARGLIGVAVSLAAWLLAGLGAFLFGGDVGRGLSDSGASWGSYAGGYALCFAAIWVGVGVIGYVIRRIAHSYGLSEMDRLMGLGLGLLRGLIFACALLVLLAMTTLPRERSWRDSGFAMLLMPGAKLMRSALPDAMARKVDLEGRGGSLQETVQAEANHLESNLKGKMKSAGGGLTDGFGGLPEGLGGLAGGAQAGPGRDPAQVLPDALPEPQADARGGGSGGGLADLLPGAMRDLLPQSGGATAQGEAGRGQRRGEDRRIQDDGRAIDARNDDKQVQ